MKRSGKTVHLGGFRTAEEAALCVARSPAGQAATAERAAAAALLTSGDDDGKRAVRCNLPYSALPPQLPQPSAWPQGGAGGGVGGPIRRIRQGGRHHQEQQQQPVRPGPAYAIGRGLVVSDDRAAMALAVFGKHGTARGSGLAVRSGRDGPATGKRRGGRLEGAEELSDGVTEKQRQRTTARRRKGYKGYKGLQRFTKVYKGFNQSTNFTKVIQRLQRLQSPQSHAKQL